MKKLSLVMFCLALCLPAGTALAMPDNSAKAVCLIHQDTGEVLYSQNADERMLIASTTKVMTALIAIENCNPEEEVTIPLECTLVEGSSMYLRAGEIYTVADLLYGLMLVSGNDAALALAWHVGGGVEGFAEMMNDKAAELGLRNSSFRNPHGLDAEWHYSSAADLAVIMRAAMEHELFREVTGSRSRHIKGQTYINHNKLLWKYEGVTGGKTGYTKAAGRSLISSAERGNLRLICVTIGDPDDWDDHEDLYDWAFDNYDYVSVLEPGELTRIPVISGETGTVGVAPFSGLSLLVEKGQIPELRVELPRFVFAGVYNGSYAGRAVVRLGDDEEIIGLYYSETVGLDMRVKLSGWERFLRFLRVMPTVKFYGAQGVPV